jgi:hypothetical protein
MLIWFYMCLHLNGAFEQLMNYNKLTVSRLAAVLYCFYDVLLRKFCIIQEKCFTKK